MLNKEHLHEEMLRTVNKSIKGEQFIRNYYKFPIGLFVLNDMQSADEMYNHVMNEIPDRESREFDTYYDCWLYLYTKLSNNPMSKFHYEIILKNKIASTGFSAVSTRNPELRATAISMICASFEKDTKIVNEAANFIARLHLLNKGQGNFYFMTNKDNNLIKNFPIEHERTHVFKTKKARPMLYSFSLAIIALINVYKQTELPKYLKLASEYANFIIQNDFKNDYCGKSLVAMCMMYEVTKQKKYMQMADSLNQYIGQLTIRDNFHTHDGKLISVDRLSEYAIGMECYDRVIART